MVSALRRIRSELGVSPAKQVTLLLQGGNADDAARAGRFASQLKFLNRIERIDTIAGDPPPAAAAVVGELKLFVPLAGLVDLDAERVRLDKELKRVEGELAKSQGKLASDTFVQNAPAAVVEQERQRLADWTTQRDALAAAARETAEHISGSDVSREAGRRPSRTVRTLIGEQLDRHHQRILASILGRVIARTPADLVEAFIVVQRDRVRVRRTHFEEYALCATRACDLQQRTQQAPAMAAALHFRRRADVEHVRLVDGKAEHAVADDRAALSSTHAG